MIICCATVLDHALILIKAVRLLANDFLTVSMLTRLIFVPIALFTLSAAAFADGLIGQASVIDGDTLEIHCTRIRIFGIDAPESDQLCRNEESEVYRCYGVTVQQVGATYRREGVVPTRRGVVHVDSITNETVEVRVRPAGEGVAPARGEGVHGVSIADETVIVRIRPANEIVVATVASIKEEFSIAIDLVAVSVRPTHDSVARTSG